MTPGSGVTLGTMTGSKWALTPPLTGIAARDVVAGLLGLAGTQAVARAAAQEAASRGARVRFVHLVPDGTDAAQRDEADNASFAAALRALREFPRVPVTFEIAEGEPGPALVERSIGADILVVAAGDPVAGRPEASGASRARPAARGSGASHASDPSRATAAPEATESPESTGGAESTESTGAADVLEELAAYCQRHAECDVLTVRTAPPVATGLASTA